MRKTTILLSLMVLAAMVLAACGGGPTSTNVAPTQLPITAVASEPSTATEMPTETAVATESPAVPVTGASGAAGQMSERLRFKVMDQSGNQLGTVSDLVLNLSQAQVLYVIVNAQGNKVAVPRSLFSVQSAAMTEPGTGLATATPAGIATGQTGTGLSTATPDTGTGLSTSTPSTGGSGTGLSTSTPSASTGTGAGNALGQNAFIFQGDPAMLQNAPAFDVKNVPGLGQAPDSWDISIRKYWSGDGTSSGTSNTPEPVGTAVTDTTPTTTGGSGTGTGTGSALSTSTPSVPVTGNGGMLGQGATSIQGVALASQVIGAKLTIGMQAVIVPSTGTGSSSATSTPSAGGTTSSTATPNAGGTGLATSTPETGSATATPSAGGAGTTSSTSTPSAGSGSGTNATVTGTIDDLLVNDAGTILYIVLRTNLSGSQTLIPVPLKFLQLDSDNAFVLNVDPAMLQSAPSFSNGQLPDMSTSGWDSEFNSFWQSNSGSGAANPTATP